VVFVSTSEHRLWLCQDGRSRARFAVALGSGGVDKRTQGDRKVPLGSYELGLPRPSARFGTFVPIAYPTAEQRKLGFTGQDVGIHGPERRARWLGRANTWLDWTAGCVALGTEEDLAQVTRFVRDARPRVEIR
jgi:murein L,D-transpeptidase YafK